MQCPMSMSLQRHYQVTREDYHKNKPKLKRLAWYILNVDDEERIHQKLEDENLSLEEASIVFVLSSVYEQNHIKDAQDAST
jgi:adenine-specific DNA glycosylase